MRPAWSTNSGTLCLKMRRKKGGDGVGSFKSKKMERGEMNVSPAKGLVTAGMLPLATGYGFTSSLSPPYWPESRW